MRCVDETKFLADYDLAVKEREDLIATKDTAIKAEVEKAERVILDNGYSDAVKELLIAEVVAEKKKEFDLTKLDAKVDMFKAYIIEKEDVVEDEDNECSAEVRVDEFGNPIV